MLVSSRRQCSPSICIQPFIQLVNIQRAVNQVVSVAVQGGPEQAGLPRLLEDEERGQGQRCSSENLIGLAGEAVSRIRKEVSEDPSRSTGR